MVSIEAFDELLAVYILLVCRASIPKMCMPIDDENFFTLGCPVHGVSPAPARIECYEARRWRSRIGLAGTHSGQALFAVILKRWISSSRSWRRTASPRCHSSLPCV